MKSGTGVRPRESRARCTCHRQIEGRGALFAEEKPSCDYCGQAVHPVSDFVDRAAARVLEMRGKVEQVSGAAAERLQRAGNIGALLRF